MNDEQIVYEYLQDAQHQLSDITFLCCQDQVANLIQQLIELSSFLLEKIKNGRSEIFELQQSIDDQASHHKNEMGQLQNSLLSYQILYQEETQKQQQIYQQMCSLEEELNRYKYHNMLIQTQISSDKKNSEQMLSLIQELQNEIYSLKDQCSEVKSENSQLKNSKLELIINFQKLQDELSIVKDEHERVRTQLQLEIKKNKILQDDMFYKPSNTIGSFLTPAKFSNQTQLQQKFTQMKKCLSNSNNYSMRYDSEETDIAHLKTEVETEEVQIRDFLYLSLQNQVPESPITKRNFYFEESPSKILYDSLSKSKQKFNILENELQMKDGECLQPKDFAYEPENFKTIVTNFNNTIQIDNNTIKNRRINQIERLSQIPEDLEPKSIRTLQSSKMISMKSIQTSKDTLISVNQDFIIQFKNNFAIPFKQFDNQDCINNNTNKNTNRNPNKKQTKYQNVFIQNKKSYFQTLSQLMKKVTPKQIKFKRKNLAYSILMSGLMRHIFGLK